MYRKCLRLDGLKFLAITSKKSNIFHKIESGDLSPKCLPRTVGYGFSGPVISIFRLSLERPPLFLLPSALKATPRAAERRTCSDAHRGYRSSSFGWIVVERCPSCKLHDREDGDGMDPTSNRRSAWKKGAPGHNGE